MNQPLALQPNPSDYLREFGRLVAKMRKGDPTTRTMIAGVAIVTSSNLTPAEVDRLAVIADALCAPAPPDLVLKAAETIFDAYRTPEFAKVEATLELYSRFLSSYPAQALVMLMDVRRSDNILRRCKFFPTMAEIADWLDPLAAHWRDVQKQVEAYRIGLASQHETTP